MTVATPSSLLLELGWLPPAPVDWRERLRTLPADPAAAAAMLQRLATCQIGRAQATRLGKALATATAAAPLPGLTPLRLGIAANATMDMIADLVPAAALRHRLAVDCAVAPFGEVFQQAVDPGSLLNRAGCDAILVALDHHAFGLDRPCLGDVEAACVQHEGQLAAIVAGFRQHSSATVIVQTIPVPPVSLLGSADRGFAGSPRAMIERLNAAIVRLARGTGLALLDVAALAGEVGTHTWFDDAAWHAYRLPAAGACAAIHAEWLARVLGALRGNARKCLVLDLDNTCWAGVVGDDGIDGICLGEGTPAGEAHRAVQRFALDLRERGIVLAVASKNEDATARLPFRDHPEMLLREGDFAVFQANWQDKPANLAVIAATLNLGTEALVMLDDNPAERAQIRATMPEVGVPELPADPAQFVRVLQAAGYFEALGLSDDDRLRAGAYAADSARAEVRATTATLEDYLASLDMTIGFAPVAAGNLARAAQLVNKTNQFNLTTRRHAEAEVAAFATDPDAITLCARLADRFGDLGLIGVILARAAGDTLVVDSWVMSCRVLGRRVEHAMLAALVGRARAAGLATIAASYLPTAKNAMVRDLLDRLGFTLAVEDAEGARHYTLALAEAPMAALPMRVENAESLEPSP